MALTDDVKVALRVSSNAYDAEVAALVAAALADMKIQQDVSLGHEESPDPLARMAVLLFCKARFGYDNDEAPRFEESYRQTVADLANSPAYTGGDAS